MVMQYTSFLALQKSRQLQCEPVIELHRSGVRVRSMSLARMQENVRELESSRSNTDDDGTESTASSAYVSVYSTLNDASTARVKRI